MMFALGIIDKLTPGALTGGENVAGTGTIDSARRGRADRRHPPEDVRGAEDAGADWFLAPASNCDEVAGHVPDGLEVFAVSTLDEALTVVRRDRRRGGHLALRLAAPQPEQPFPRIATLGWSLDPTATEQEAESVSTAARTEDAAPSRAARHHDRGGRAARHRVLRVRRASTPMCSGSTSSASSTCSPRSGSRALVHVRRRVPRDGPARLGVSIADRLPLATGVREAQLAARPLPAGLRAAAPPRDVRHPDRARHLRRRLGRRAAGSSRSQCLQPHAVRHDRPAVRPRRRLLRLRAAVLPRRSSASRRPSCCSRWPRRARDLLPLRRHPRQRSRGAHLAVRAHPARRSRPALYLLLQAVSIWFDQYATAHRRTAPSSPAPATPTSTP